MTNPLAGLGDWFQRLSPQAQQALIAGGFSATGALLESRGQAGEANANREMQLGGALAGVEQGALQTDRQGAQDVLGQTRMGEIPSTYGNLAMRRALFESLAPGTTFGNVGGFQAPEQFRDEMPTFGGPSLDGAREQAMKYFSDDALQADLARRLNAEARVDPNGSTFDMTSMFGAGAAPAMGQIQQTKDKTNAFITDAQDRTRTALQGALAGAPQSGVQRNAGGVQTVQQKGTPWWKKALGVGLGAAGLIAAPFTGGVSTALIGAGGALAGSKLMGGSNKDALMAALGGATAGLGKGGGTTAGAGGGFAGMANTAAALASQIPQSRVGRVPRVRF
jgi:hypothetical protein